MILLDTSGLLAWIDAGQRWHAETASVMAGTEGPYLLSPFVLAELDYLVGTRVGSAARDKLLAEVEEGSLSLVSFEQQEVGKARRMMQRFSDLDIGLTDASITVLSERYSCRDLLSLDERHFRVLPGFGGKPFRLLPADG